MPYYSTPRSLAEEICTATGMILVPPTLEVEPFLAALRQCGRIVAEAMHGAILADAFRIPWIGCRILSALREGPTSTFKWGDWMDSLGIQTKFSTSLPPALYRAPTRFRARLAGHARRRAVAQITAAWTDPYWTLSTDSALERAQSRILEKADALAQGRPARQV
ncbi:hypothetical protein [Pararhodobacter sp. SW119]|uniref:polysaccharide pyruvyl transferase family protein n=1 Tax=Pararhodobacter sp. SW119 TaxID=2780075 RepID=UPI001AE0A81C|nr:hypothetical protein [Pararhodobacter sp. SW119]